MIYIISLISVVLVLLAGRGISREGRSRARAAYLLPILLCKCAYANERIPISAYPISVKEFHAAIEREASAPQSSLQVTGVGGPHHLLAADLIARAMMATRGNRYDRIILLSPDHYFKSARPASTTMRSFDTIVGRIETDTTAAARLLEAPSLFADSNLFEGEHGILAWLPFIRKLQPDTPIVAIALSIGSTQSDWDDVIKTLRTIVTPRTLIVQSTDYSHYLLPAVARFHDQQTLNVIAAGDTSAFSRLMQPDHLDSRAAAYIQMQLQASFFDASPVVVANRTSYDYIPRDEPTTSYIVTVYSPDRSALSRLRYDDQAVYFFGGDVLVGRHFARLATDSPIRDRLTSEVLRITNGAPFVVNLEGAIADEIPVGTPPARHVMLTNLTLPILKAMHVVAASQANNHSYDLGSDGARETSRLLRENGIITLRQLQPVDLGAIRVVAINYVGVGDYKNYPTARPPVRDALSDIEILCRSAARPPLLAFVHWGEEYTDTASLREKEIANDLHRCGIVGVIGAHSHRASTGALLTAGGEQATVYSVGNLMFDQFSATSSSALVEVRVFLGGTLAMRVIPMANLYELGLALQRSSAH